MSGYLAGIWMLRRGEPPCPKMVASHLVGRGEVAAALRSATPAEAEAEAEEARALRVALLVNLAAAALRLSEWSLARAACEAALEAEPRHAKALFRLARAHEGMQQHGEALAALAAVLELEPSNAEARRLRESLRAQKKREGQMFGACFERAANDGEGLYTAADEKKDFDEAIDRNYQKMYTHGLAHFRASKSVAHGTPLDPRDVGRLQAAKVEMEARAARAGSASHGGAAAPG